MASRRILFPEGPPVLGRHGSDGPPKFDKSNLGRRITRDPPPDLFGNRNPYEAFRVIDIDPALLPPGVGDRPGSWVLSLSAEYIWPPPGTPVAGTYGAVTAAIRFTSGNASHEILVDAWNTRIQIPSDQCSVDVYWEGLGPAPDGISPIWTFPVRITAGVERTSSFNGSLAPLKSYWVLGADPDTREVTVPIPPFATAWNFLPMAPVGANDLPLEFAAAIHGSDDQVLDVVVASMARMNQFRALPSAAKSIFLRFADYPIQWPGRVQFQINA